MIVGITRYLVCPRFRNTQHIIFGFIYRYQFMYPAFWQDPVYPLIIAAVTVQKSIRECIQA